MSNDVNNLKDKNVYIFGAGLAGSSALEHLDDSINVLGFIDNDPQKVGSELSGHKVYSPQHLADAMFDLVLIASEYFEQITQQLSNALKLANDKMLVLPARMLKPVTLGQSGTTRDNALQVLFIVSECFNQNNVNYYIDAGTLLGIYRDGQLIPWDDDLDLAVNADDLQAVKHVMNTAMVKLQAAFGVAWEVQEHHAKEAFGAVPEGAVRGLKLKTCEPDEELPMMDIFVKYVQGDVMDYTLSSRGITMPSKHILDTVPMLYQQRNLRIPYDVEGYLTSHYGDWRTPVKDWNLGMLKSATVF